MAISGQYQTYYGIHLDHWEETWGGTSYNKMLITDFPTTNLVSTGTTKASSANFLYPTLVKNKYYLDGVAEGHFTLYNDHGSTEATVTAYTVSLKKTPDVPNNETTLGSYTNSISANNSVATMGYLTLPIFLNISKQVVNANEKLILHIEYTSAYNDVCVSHENTSEGGIDIQLKIPFAPTG